MNRFIEPDVRKTFRESGIGFVSRSIGRPGGPIAAPPYTIASVARNRIIAGAEFALPAGYNNDTLEYITAATGFYDEDLRVDSRQAEELASIGRQILTLNERGDVQPPLEPLEDQTINYLVGLVDRMIAE